MPNLLDHRLDRRLAELDRAGLARRLPEVAPTTSTRYRLAGRDVVGFCSNDYLAFATDPPPPLRSGPLVSGATRPGAAASRLVCGDLPVHRDLERRFAELLGTEDAVLFPSGFQANLGLLPALIDEGDAVYSDRLAHASLIDGLRLSPAHPTILDHRAPPPPPIPGAATWWVTESIFSMDGGCPDPAHLRRFCDAGGLLYLDEAHAAGLFPGGRGLAGQHGLDPALTLFTLGKAFGAAGAVAGASATVAHWIRTRARTFVFSTGTSPLVAEHLRQLLPILTGPEGDRRRQRLWENAAHLAARLGAEPEPPSPIFPVVVGENAAALDVAASLLEAGYHVQPIRPPTVPPGTARLRVTVTAAHTPAQIDALADTLHRTFEALGLRPRVVRGALRASTP